MDENIVERAIVPHNPTQAKVLQKEKYDLFAPIVKKGQAGMAKFDEGTFLIKDGAVYLHKDAIVKLLDDTFGRYLRTDYNAGQEIDLWLTSGNNRLSKMNIKLDAYLGASLTGPNEGSRDWLTIKLTATGDNDVSAMAYKQVLLPITQIRDLRFVRQDETDEYKLVLEYFDAVDQATKTVEVNVPEYPIATSGKAGVVKVSQGSATGIGITDGLIKVLKATEEHIAARGANYTDYVLTASKTNDIVKAALIDGKKMDLDDDEKVKARETLGAASTEDVNGMHLALSMDNDFKLFVSLLNAKNEVISTHNIDLPLEEMIVSGKVSDDGEKIILTLRDGNTLEFSVATLVNGLVKQVDFDELKEKVENQEVPKIELAPTLDGNDADKAPSVQAVNEGLANALKCEKSGTSLALTDISPLTHPLKVSVEGVEDLSSVKVLVLGKNLFDINSSDGFLTTSGGLSNEIIGNEIKVVCSAQGRSGSLKLGTFNAGTYYISIASNPSSTFHVFVGDRLGELTNAQLKLPCSITITKPTTIWVYTAFSNTVESYIISNIQFELGNTATEYEPYKGIEYAVNTDGTVDGIKSIYPSMVLMTNTTGATIKCEYNRDAAKYADKVDGKLDTVTSAGGSSRLYAVTSAGTQSLMNVGRGANPSWVVQREEKGHVLVPLTPTAQDHSTSKKYVDDTAAAIRAELGKQVFTVSQSGNDFDGWSVPDVALPNFYLETTLLEYSYEVDGVYAENFAKANFTELTFLDENNKVLDTKPATSQTFYEMPSGTAKILNNAIELNYKGLFNPPWDSCVMHLPDLKFQVKVGA